MTGSRLTPSPPSRLAVAVALGLVYVVWGSTYFAIRVGIEGFPPLLFAGIRFVIAGAALYGVERLRGTPSPTRAGWGAAFRVGVLLLTIGNAGICVVERRVPSGLAATVVASVPLWVTLFAAVGGHKPTGRELGGMVIGVGCVGLMQMDSGLRGDPAYAAILVASTASWALGSVWSRKLPMPPALMGSAASMLSGGAVLLALAALRREWPVRVPSVASVEALVYLIVMGSMVAYSAYAWLLRSVPPALATSYAYVNPVIALGLGGAFLGERVGPLAIVATAGILGGVALVTIPAGPRSERSRTAPAAVSADS
jgi:drug/metabolite transporter (DMT)-like permease